MRSNRGQERDQNKVGELHNNHNGNRKEESQKSPQTDMIIGMELNRTNDVMVQSTGKGSGNRGLMESKWQLFDSFQFYRTNKVQI